MLGGSATLVSGFGPLPWEQAWGGVREAPLWVASHLSCVGASSTPAVLSVPTERCFLGNGTEYRGVASTAASGLGCLAWNSDLLYQELHVDSVGAAALLGLGPHAYCRSAPGGHHRHLALSGWVAPRTQLGPALPRWPDSLCPEACPQEAGQRRSDWSLRSKHRCSGCEAPPAWVPKGSLIPALSEWQCASCPLQEPGQG